MDNPSRLWVQIAVEAGVSPNKAKLGAYMANLAQDGRTLEDAARALRRKPATIKQISREFMIDWPDYRPFAALESKGLPRPAPKVKLAA